MTNHMHNHSSHRNTASLQSRRRLLSAAGFAALLAASARSAAECAGPIPDDIPQPDKADHRAFIRRAFEMRDRAIELGDQPYGAIVVQQNRIVGQSWSRVILDADPTGHAEMSALRDAATRLARRNLGGTILYSSSRPCSMCEAAARWCGIEEMIYGEDGARVGPIRVCG